MFSNSKYKLKDLWKIPVVGFLSVAGFLSSCSSEDLDPGSNRPLAGKVNLEISLSLPVSSRSYTTGEGGSDAGREDGTLKESTINTLNLYLCEVDATDDKPDNDKLCYSFYGLNEVEVATETKNNFTYYKNTVKFDVDPDLFAKSVANKKLRLYFVANGSIDGAFNPSESTFSFNSLSANGLGVFGTEGLTVPLVNLDGSAILDFTGKDEAAVMEILASAEENTLNLNEGLSGKLTGTGDIELERAVARIDYKDRDRTEKGSSTGFLDASGMPFESHLYPLGLSGLYLKVMEMKVINVSKQSYTFRHSSSGTDKEGDNGTGVSLFGYENGNGTSQNPYTWIADNDWTTKATTTGSPSAGYFLNQPVLDNGKWDFGDDWTNVPILTAQTDNFDNYLDKQYHCWRYVSENTLPSVESMINGLSTGVIFKVMLCNVNGKPITENQLLWDSNENVAPTPWNGKVSVVKDAQGDIKISYGNTSTTLEKRGKSSFANFRNTRIQIEPEPDPNLPVTQPDPDPYPLDDESDEVYCLNYFYWIRHNDASNNINVTDPMEFSVVRNNVYKLQITKFNLLPKDYDPEAPDEEIKDTFEIHVSVNPWWYYKITLSGW